jgi:serpin B
MKRLLAFSLVALLVGGTVSLAEKVDVEPVVDGNTRFALDLYEQLKSEKGNLFYAPYSISSAFAMTYAGARGDTAKEMKKVFDFPAEDKLNAGFQALNEEINGETNKKRGYQLTVANSLWGQKDYPWNKDFLAHGKKFYGAGLQDVDFIGATEQARQTINGWVEKQTNDKIKDLLKPGILDSNTRMVLTNAVYFKGDWFRQFKKDRTQDKLFNMDGGKSEKTPMMFQAARFSYGEDNEVQVLKMPYVGKEVEMVVILPKKVDGLAKVEKSLTPNNLARWVETTRETTIEVTLPKFKIDQALGLKATLSKMGMPTAFTFGKADFTGIATAEKLYLQDAVHKAFVDVNEEGTEAAGATGVIVGTKGGPPTEIPRFTADHPFIFLIRDTRNESILFLGRYSEVPAK